MKKTSGARLFAASLILAIAISGLFFTYHAGKTVSARRAENERLISLADTMLKQYGESLAERNNDIDLIKNRIDVAGYRAYAGKSEKRILEYRKNIAGILTSRAKTAAAQQLESSMIKYAAISISIEYSFKICVESIVFSYGAAASDTCHDMSADPIFEDLAKTNKRIRNERDRLVDINRNPMKLYSMPAANPTAIAKSSKTNVVFILVDTLRNDMLDASSDGMPVSPNMQRLAHEGVRFTGITSGAPGTYTAVASIMTGCDSLESNAERISKWNKKISLVEKFREAGYHTDGYSANSIISETNGFDYGFDHLESRIWPPAVVIMNELQSSILDEKPEAPFFLFVHLIDPHAPYFSPDNVPYIATHGHPDGFILTPSIFRDEALKRGPAWAANTMPANLAYLKSLYAKEVTYADKWIGNLMDFLGKNGMLDNTLVVITADHGEQFFEHGDMEHAKYLWEELVHVPLILYGKLPPGLSPGQTVGSNHSSMEILPSILKWQGIPLQGTPARRAGLFDAKDKQPDAPVFSITQCCKLDNPGEPAEIISLRSGNYKIIMETKSGKMRLFDLSADPGEQKDISAAEPALAKTMSKHAMATMRASIRARDRSGVSPKVSRKLKHQLKSLGYIK